MFTVSTVHSHHESNCFITQGLQNWKKVLLLWIKCWRNELALTNKGPNDS